MPLTANRAVDSFLRLLYSESELFAVRFQLFTAMKVDKRQFKVAFDIQCFGFLMKGLSHFHRYFMNTVRPPLEALRLSRPNDLSLNFYPCRSVSDYVKLVTTAWLV